MSTRRELADGGVVELFDAWLSREDADLAFTSLLAEVPWTQGTIVMFGRELREPRLSAWLGDEGAGYTYSGRRLVPAPWTKTTAALRDAASSVAGCAFNSVLVNRYRDGNDSMGFHADDEPELGPDPVIASVSLGAARRFVLRHRKDRASSLSLTLPHGSLLVMAGTTQRFHRHAVPKTRDAGERLNLTFRRILLPD